MTYGGLQFSQCRVPTMAFLLLSVVSLIVPLFLRVLHDFGFRQECIRLLLQYCSEISLTTCPLYLHMLVDLREGTTLHHHFKAVKASEFILGLWAHQAFYFMNPMLNCR